MPRSSALSAYRSAGRAISVFVAMGVMSAGLVAVTDERASAVPVASCRTVPVDQDVLLRSDLARAKHGVDGAGVKVGIISNTWGLATQNSTEQENIAGGLLPGPGNPCGYITPVSVLLEGPAANADDEGRAMAQLVHGVAPGAELLFASGITDGGMIAAINFLAANDVDIIVDDISVYTEPWFQESIESTRIAQLAETGIAYFSAAANETVIAQAPLPGQTATPVNGWRTNAYRPTDCPEYLAAGADPGTLDCMDFDPTDGVDPVSQIVANFSTAEAAGVATLPIFMQWAEPFGNARAAFLLVVEAVGDLRPDGTRKRELITSEPVVADSPVQLLELNYDTSPTGFGTTMTLNISIARLTTPGVPETQITPPIGFLGTLNGPQWINSAEYWQSDATDTIGRTISGHNGGPSMVTIAATDGADEDRIDFYSSLGPVTYYLSSQTMDGLGTVLAEPRTLAKPQLLSVDAVSNTVLGIPTADPSVFIFRGTSAATPNAGAVAALAQQLDPSLTPGELADLMAVTATQIEPPYSTVSGADSIGAGLVNAEALLDAVSAALPSPTPGVQPTRFLAATGLDGDSTTALAGFALVIGGLTLRILRRRRDHQPSEGNHHG